MATNRLVVGQKKILAAGFIHHTGALPALTWSTSNAGVLTVTPAAGGGGQATIEAKVAGTATITLAAAGLTSATWDVTVVANPNGQPRVFITMMDDGL